MRRAGRDVERLRHYVCERAGCGTAVGNREVAMRKLREWVEAGKSGAKPTILCVNCEERVALWDEMEERFGSEVVRRQVLELNAEADQKLDSVSKERALVGEVMSTVALAGQVAREFAASEHGIDMEIEFKDDAGEATGRKVHLQLRSGEPDLRLKNGGPMFVVEEDQARYWMEQPIRVHLVVRNSKGETRWMEVRHWAGTGAGARHIVFDGERFDVMAVRRVRERVLGGVT